MKRYIGIDIHAASVTLCAVSESGKKLRQEVFETNGREIVRAVARIAGELHVCIEESEWSAWLHELLERRVKRLVVWHPKWQAGTKSDATDAFALAERLRTGRIDQPVFKAPRRFALLRELARTDRMLTDDIIRTKNRLRSFYRRRNLPYPGHRPEDHEAVLDELPAACVQPVGALAVELDSIVELHAEIRAEMIAESHRHPISRALETAPGLGRVRVAWMLPIVVTPHRFPNRSKFWSYCGFAVVHRSSSDWRRQDGDWKRRPSQSRGLTRDFNRTMKYIFKGAAATVVRSRAEPLWSAYQRQLERGVQPNLARLTLARRIAATTLAMWKKKERYDPKRQQ